MLVVKTAVENCGGLLADITDHSRIPPKGGTFRHRNGGNSIAHHCYTRQEGKNPLTFSEASHPRTCGAFRWRSRMVSLDCVLDQKAVVLL
ncbi:hypothetical protein AVEN_50143-1 [Araneus ventricosus]|uniref:Uncharacterized protein n=1 Tax=Araneus ventricosus TaxID=182803 RepID=A0A4Y2DCE3_ARAVE|nr:hypothetical protein AVEN_50143-1 [Araneus ventricosus]